MRRRNLSADSIMANDNQNNLSERRSFAASIFGSRYTLVAGNKRSHDLL